MLKAADFSPGQARRRRLRALGTAILTGTGLAVYGLSGPAALPALDDPSAYAMTSLAQHVVVYSVPTQAPAQIPTQTTTHTETHSSTDTITDSTAGSASGSGGSVFSPQVSDGPGGDTTVTNTGPSGSTTLTNGQPDTQRSSSHGSHHSSNDGTGDSSNSSSTPGQPGTAGGSTAAAGSVWPPLQTINGTSQLNSAVAAPASGSTALPAPVSAQTVAQPAEMLMAIQCPSSMPTGSLCLEAVTSTGTAAALPSAQNLGSLPVTSAGAATCPTAPSTSGSATSDDSSNASSSSGDSSSGGSSSSSPDSDSSGSDRSKHSGSGDSGHTQKAGKKHSKKGDNSADDSVDVLPDLSGSSTATVASCGLWDQAVSSSGAAAGDTGQVAKDVIPGSLTKIPRSGQPKQITLHTTGYSFQDNQGGNNSTISCPTIHKNAGGDGTYNNPITAAVPGHAGQGTQIPCGTEIYIPGYQRYIIVEDTGATKYTDAEHTDIYVGGEGTSAAASKKCMDPVTTSDGHPIPAIENPPPNEPVDAGPITGPGGQCQVPQGGNSGGSAQS